MVATNRKYLELVGAKPKVRESQTDDVIFNLVRIGGASGKDLKITGGHWDLAAVKLTNVADGTSATDAATKGQLDTAIAGFESVANKGQPNGYASLDGAGKVPITQLPNAIVEYKGTWNPSTNSPALANTGKVIEAQGHIANPASSTFGLETTYFTATKFVLAGAKTVARVGTYLLSTDGDITDGSIIARIREDNGGVPGAVLFSSAAVDVTGLSTDAEYKYFDFTGADLVAGTYYVSFEVQSLTGATDIYMPYKSGTTGISVYASGDSGTSWDDTTNGQANSQLWADILEALPETAPGDVYRVVGGGTYDFGAGPIAFVAGDYAILNESGVWEKADTTDAVSSVNGMIGEVELDTDNVDEGSTNLYYTQGRFDTAFGNKSTTDLAEGTNLYYTQGRFDTAFAAKSTTDLAEGSNLYYTQARFDSAFGAKSTTDLAEGTNLYFTDERAKTAAVADAIADGVTDVAPSQNAVFNALAGKADTLVTLQNDSGATLAARDFCWWYADGGADIMRVSDNHGPWDVMVMNVASLNDASSGVFYRPGQVVDGFTGLTAEAPLYLAHNVAGGYTQDFDTLYAALAAGEHAIQIGYALSATKVYFDPKYILEKS